MFYKKKQQSGKKHTLDTVFSRYIRLRDADENGYCTCITCQKTLPWSDVDAGHFVSRARLSTRYNEKNVNAQCRHCNRFCAGMQYEHGKAIDKKHGAGTADSLVALSSKLSKLTQTDYDALISLYRSKVALLKK